MIFIDYHSRMPIYEQIKEQIIMLINTGVYAKDEQLPSIRALSKELNINVNTIKRAFQELERDGVTYSVQGRGVFVAAETKDNEAVIKEALTQVENAVRSAKVKGVALEEIYALAERLYKEGDNND
ncbi:MAG: GntR family transcriptional regulator [Eubacterium sp.]|nr:GntR family transcriptional regulator [Eubacterium sp.]